MSVLKANNKKSNQNKPQLLNWIKSALFLIRRNIWT